MVPAHGLLQIWAVTTHFYGFSVNGLSRVVPAHGLLQTWAVTTHFYGSSVNGTSRMVPALGLLETWAVTTHLYGSSVNGTSRVVPAHGLLQIWSVTTHFYGSSVNGTSRMVPALIRVLHVIETVLPAINMIIRNIGRNVRVSWGGWENIKQAGTPYSIIGWKFIPLPLLVKLVLLQ
jgi:hypothetical protein